MTIEIALVLAVIAGALYLFATQKLRLDVTALGILVVLMTLGLLGNVEWLTDRGIDLPGAFPTVAEGLSGLSNPATVTVLAMFILSAGVQRSGLIHVVGQRIVPFVGNSEIRLLLVVAVLVGLVSGLVNNTASVAVAIPFVIDLARRLKLSASRLLMPLSFFGMLGGMLTLVGTSTSILAAGVFVDDPDVGRQIGMFEFTHLGIIVLATGVIYFLTVGRVLLPAKDAVKLTREEDESFIVEVGLRNGSRLVGKRLSEPNAITKSGVTVMKLVRGGRGYVERATTMTLADRDIIQVRGTVRQIMDLIAASEVDVRADIREPRTARGNGVLVRMLLRNRRRFDGGTAASVGFWERYRVRLIGLDAEHLSARRLADEPLHVGEVCLVEVASSALPALRRNQDVVLLGESTDDFDTRRMLLSGAIMLAVVLVAAFTPLPIVVTALAGVVLMVVTGVITTEDLYTGVPWEIIFLLAAVIPLGIAMTKSGGADWLAGILTTHAEAWHPIVVLMVLYVFTTLLTELVSNNASVVILVPVAIAAAIQLDLPVFALVLTVMFAASTSFLSPVGYQTNAMVFGTGLYKFTDFARVGGPLNLLLMIVTSVSIWILWM